MTFYEIRNPYIGNHWLGIPIIIGLWHFKWAILGSWMFIGILILAYYNFLYNWVPYIQQISKGFGHCSSGFLPPAVSRYLSKTVRCWRNVPSNQVFFSFLHLHWYYIIQSFFESSKPLSSDQGIVITGTLHHLQGWKFCLFSFAIWEIHQTSTSMDTGFPTFSICWIPQKKTGVITFAAKKKLPNSIRNFFSEKLPLHCRSTPKRSGKWSGNIGPKYPSLV